MKKILLFLTLMSTIGFSGFAQVVTVSGESPQWDEGKEKLTDGILTNQWGVEGTTAWIQFAYATPTVNNVYSLTTSFKEPTRDFKDWTVSGSNDGTTWTVLDTQTGHAPWATRSSTLDFTFVNTTAYTYYRLNVTALNGGSYVQLAEMSFSARPVVTVSGESPQWDEGKDKLTNGILTDQWGVEATTAWIQFAYPTQVIKNAYSLTSATKEPTRDFKDWTVSGSNNGTDWTVLDTQTGHAPWAARSTTLSFNLTNTTAYSYYKLNVTALNGGSYTQLGEISFDTKPVVTVSGESPQWDEGKDKLTDGILTNQWGVEATTAWIQFAYATPTVNNMYSLTSATKEPTRDFKDWTVEGSNDGTTWTVLDTRTGHAPWAARSTTIDFYYANTTAYTYYKLNVTALNGGTYTQLGEISFGNGVLVLPLVVTVSGDNADPWGEGPEKLVDGDLYTKWSVGTNTAWIQFAYTEAKRWNKYSLTSGNDAPTRDFKDWTLQGSNDGTAWTTLDTQTGHPQWTTRNSTLDFDFTNLASYKFYKFDVTANNGDNVTQLSEIAFSFELAQDALVYTTSGSCAPYITYNNWYSLQADSTYMIEKTVNPIVLDGVAESAWDEANAMVIKKVAHEKKLGDVLDLSVYPQTEADLYAKYKALWTENGVYMLIDVKDDLVRYQNPDYQWENDGVEFYFAKGVGEGKIQLIIPAMVGTTNPAKPAAKDFESGSATGSDPSYKVFGFDTNNWDETIFSWAIKKTATGYTLEVYMDKDIVTNGNSDTNYGLGKMFAGDVNVDEADEKLNDNDPALFVREGTLAMLGNSNQEYAGSNNYGWFKMVNEITTSVSTLSSSEFNVFYSSANKQITIRSNSVVSATLYTIAGQAMTNKYINGKMNVDNLKSGIYIINGKDANGNRVGSSKVAIF
jgi:hypothetical protein